MSWYDLAFELIDMRSFSNLWYWIVLAVTWSTTSHWIVGIPWDMVQRARRVGGRAAEDLETVARIHAGRVNYIVEVAGMWIVGTVFFGLAVLGTLGFWFGNEFSQAVFLLVAPLSVVGALSVRTARRIAGAADLAAICRTLGIHRRIVQFIGMLAIFVTSLWGMWQNINANVLGI